MLEPSVSLDITPNASRSHSELLALRNLAGLRLLAGGPKSPENLWWRAGGGGAPALGLMWGGQPVACLRPRGLTSPPSPPRISTKGLFHWCDIQGSTDHSKSTFYPHIQILITSHVGSHLPCPDFTAGTGQLTLNSLWSWGRKGRGAGNSQQTATEAISQVGPNHLSNGKA